MKIYDRAASLFWLSLSICICIESLHLGIGTLRNPDIGFMAFGASVLLGILSLALFLQTSLRKENISEIPIFTGKLWKRVFLVLTSLLIYARLMTILGYLLSTFLLMSFLFWVVKGQKWWWVLVLSFLSTLSTYYIFSVWLKCQFPVGLFGL